MPFISELATRTYDRPDSPPRYMHINSSTRHRPQLQHLSTHAHDATTGDIDSADPSSKTGYCDPRLQAVRIDFWTNVEIDGDLATGLISLYLENDYPTTGLFDAGLFLDDLVNEGTTFCSPLLVNSILFWACVGHYIDIAQL